MYYFHLNTKLVVHILYCKDMDNRNMMFGTQKKYVSHNVMYDAFKVFMAAFG